MARRVFRKLRRIGRPMAIVKKEIVDEFSQNYSILKLEKIYILKETFKPTEKTKVEVLEKQEFKDLFADDCITLQSGRKKSRALFWLESKDKKIYYGLQNKNPLQSIIKGYFNVYNTNFLMHQKHKMMYNLTSVVA